MDSYPIGNEDRHGLSQDEWEHGNRDGRINIKVNGAVCAAIPWKKYRYKGVIADNEKCINFDDFIEGNCDI